MSATEKRVRDFDETWRLMDELIGSLHQMSGSRELERYSDHEKIHYVPEEKTTGEQLEVTRSYLTDARSRFPIIQDRLFKASDS